ncbi:sulfotransferase [Rhodobacteraceae bacterium DSL-40]|uniref:sulfotransferase n=1 Tax=Amaricoccus sp. B4 TaxID=3368557 RepID=UPI0013A6DFDE
MTLLALIAGCLAFIAVLRVTNAVAVTGQAARTAQQAAAVMQSRELSDDEKEAHVRRASAHLLRSFAGITLIGAAALLAPAAILWGGQSLGILRMEEALEMALGWPFLLGTTAFALGGWGVARALRTSDEAVSADQRTGPAGVPYGAVDRALHSFAFRNPDLQKNLADMETRLYRRSIDPERTRKPVFVTSLPRAGTTVMLDMLAKLPEFASATYRHMPFTLTPLLWGHITGAMQRKAEVSERAHGDGIEIGFDSPEAFEEMAWLAFWQDHYHDDRIVPWKADESHPEFEAFFRQHMAKIVASRAGGGATRYLSKNNANIARLPLLERLVPDATIVVPVRNPWAHAASLQRQHLRFLKLHDEDTFARAYMEGLGHFEFGRALKPIAFSSTAHDIAAAGELEFWLRYWVDAYQTVLETAGPQVIFVDHDALCRAPGSVLPALADALDIDTAKLLAAGQGLRAQSSVAVPKAPAELIAHAQALHGELVALSVHPRDAEPKRLVSL